MNNSYDVRSDYFSGSYENPIRAVENWRKWPNARLFVALWVREEDGESTLIGEPIDITHLALHLIEDERERGQRRAK